MGATEKKVALVISFKTEGGQVIAVNLKNIGDAQEQAAKKTVIHTKALEDMGRKVLGFLQFKLAVKAVKEVSQALSELSTYSLGFMSASAPLRAGFDESSSRMKLGFAQVTSVALPAVIGFQKAIGDALDELGTFVDKNRELVATNIAEWAGDAGRAIITGIALAASVANKALHGLTSGISTVKAIALGFAASLGEGEKDSIFTARAKQLRTESDLAWASASRSMREMDAYDAKIKVIEEKTKSYVGTAVASAKEIAKNKVTVSDPEKDAAALSAKEREIAKYIELATLAHDEETALSNSTLAWFALNEAKKMTIAGESADAYAARQDAITQKLFALDQLETQIHAKELTRTANLAQAKADAESKLTALLQSNADRREEIAKTEFERRKAYADRSLSEESARISAMESGFGKAQALVTQWQRIEGERRKALAAGERDYALQLEAESKQAKMAALQEYKTAAAGVLSTLVGGFKEIFRAGVEGTKDMGQVAIGVAASIGEAIVDKLLGMFISFLAEQIAGLLVKSAIQSTLGANAAVANVTAESAVAGASAAASYAAIPLIGWSGAVAVGEAVQAAVAAAFIPIAAGSAALAQGGLIIGGSIGRDSVPAMLMPGEYVVPAAQVRQNIAAGRAPDDSGKAGGGGGGGVSISVTQQSFVPGTKADFNRSVRDAVLPAIQQLARQGLLNLRGG